MRLFEMEYQASWCSSTGNILFTGLSFPSRICLGEWRENEQKAPNIRRHIHHKSHQHNVYHVEDMSASGVYIYIYIYIYLQRFIWASTFFSSESIQYDDRVSLQEYHTFMQRRGSMPFPDVLEALCGEVRSAVHERGGRGTTAEGV